MYPYDLELFGFSLAIWNAAFLLAILVGYTILRSSAWSAESDLESRVPIRFLAARYAATVYLSAVAAQLFAYAFDLNTTLLPPIGRGVWSYYLDPLAGPKTLYGVIVLLPASVALATVSSGWRLGPSLDLWTPSLLSVLSVARIGCLLQGCCHGSESEVFGIAFPEGSPVFFEHLRRGLVSADASASSPVIPTQALEAAFLALLAVWSFVRGVGVGRTFAMAVASYSVFRFAIEFLRADLERGMYGALSTSQWIAVLVLVSAVAWIYRMVPRNLGGVPPGTSLAPALVRERP